MYTPVAQRNTTKRTGYIPVANRTNTPTERPIAPTRKPVELTTPFASTRAGVAVNTVKGLPKAFADVGKSILQGSARGYAATGQKIAQGIDELTKGKNELVVGETVNPKTFFGTSPTAQKIGVAVFGKDKPFSAQSEDKEFLEAFGVDPKNAGKTGGAVTVVLSALDVFGGGQGAKGLAGLTKALRIAKTADEASEILRGVRVSEDLISEYAPVFAKAKTIKEVGVGLEALAKIQETTKVASYIPVAERAGDDIVKKALDANKARLVKEGWVGMGIPEKPIATDARQAFVLSQGESHLDEAKKVGAKRLSPDKIAHQQLTPSEGIEALVKSAENEAQKKSGSWLNAVTRLDELLGKYGEKGVPPRGSDDFRVYINYKKYAPGSSSLKQVKDTFIKNAERVAWNAEKESAYRLKVVDEYKNLIKKDISKGYRFPDEVLKYDKSFETATNNRARYEKGLNTSFSADDSRIVFDEENRIVAGMKRQDGKELLPQQKQEIIDGVLQTQKALGIDLNKLSKDERWVYAHLNGKNPFLTKNAAGLYRKAGDNISVSLGGTESFDAIVDGEKVRKRVNTTSAHEIGHALDGNVKGKLLDRSILFDLKRTFKPVEDSFRGDKYWRSDSEVTARAIEQYVAVKEGHTSLFNREGYWDETIFNSKIKPAIEKSINDNFSQYKTVPVDVLRAEAKAKGLPELPKAVAKTEDPLLTEARKYKSAEELGMNMKDRGHVLDSLSKTEQIDTLKIDSNLLGDKIGFDARDLQKQTTGKLTSNYWLKKIQNGERPSILVGLEDGKLKVLDGNHKATAYAQEGIKDVPIIYTNEAKSQLTDILKKAQPTTKTATKIPKVADEELEQIAEAIKKKDVTQEELYHARMALVFAEEAAEASPAAKLMKYVSPATGDLPELVGKETKESLTGSGKMINAGKFSRFGDDIVTELGFQYASEAQEAVDKYRVLKKNINKLKENIRSLRKTSSAALKGEKLMQLARGERRSAFRALKDRYNLTDAELSKIRGGRDLSIMSNEDFSTFLKKAEDLAENLEAKTNARISLEGTIQEKELSKWENVRDAMKLPKNVSDMTVEEMNKLNDTLSQFKTGDEFLPVRMLQTIDRTDIAGVKTTREVLEKLARKTGKDVTAMPIKPTEFHRTLGDRRLARQHPFFELLATRKNQSLLEAEARTMGLSDELNKLINAARSSRKQSLLDRFIPSDSNIVRWSEAPDQATRTALEKTMTKEEMAVAKRWDEIRREYYDYLVKRHAEQKFSRFEGTYFPHVRRGFLEAWKEDGVLKAFKEMADKYRQDAFTMEILNERTGEILPYEKWIGFAQFRTDKLIPTSNAAKAFESYITALEKARHLDEMVPEIMAYVHALSPKGLTPRGVELDTSLKKFVKEYINANKGRVPKGFFNPGGKFDVANRSLITLTRMLDLGFNFTTQVAAPIGENLMTLTMLKPQGYAMALRRLVSKDGKAIVSRYRNFTGKTLWDDMSRATSGLGDKFLSGAFALYHIATRKANELFLLGKMTDEEFKTGTITAKRLAELQLEMSKYRSIKGLESILGRTTEATAAKQYKSWAIPPLTATIENAGELAKMVRKDGISALASDAGKELFYSIGIATSLAVLFHTSYKTLSEKKGDRTFIEDVAFKAMRDALSIYGSFDPMMWSRVRTADFLQDLAKAAKDIVLLEEYKTTGDLKGPRELKNTLTPALIRGLTKEEKETKGGGGLPSLPKLPTLPKLPKLPKI